MSLHISNLSFSYRNKPILNGIDSGELSSGKLVAVLGPNAAGKSTFFRCISGLLTAQTGRIMLDDEDLCTLPRPQQVRKVCYMPQSYSSQAALTVFEVVLLARKHLNDWWVSDDDTIAVAELLRQFRIEHLAQRYIGELSGGQQQMVAVCQAMVRPARVFLLDEPTSALDLRHQLEVMQTLQTMTSQREAITIIALHDLNLAARFADHIILMKNGKIVASNDKDSVLASDALGQTYAVNVELQHSSDGVLMVGARL